MISIHRIGLFSIEVGKRGAGRALSLLDFLAELFYISLQSVARASFEQAYYCAGSRHHLISKIQMGMNHSALTLLSQWVRHLSHLGTERTSLPGLPIRSEALCLRNFTREDEDKRQRWAKFQEPYLCKFNFMPQPSEENDRSFKRLQDRIRLAIDDSECQLIGYISLKAVRGDPQAAELGICFSADSVSNGFGREALQMVIPWAVMNLKLRRIVLEVDAINSRAISLYQRFGFRKVGQTWHREENPKLKEFVERNRAASGVRCCKNRVELLSWRMEWNVDDSLQS